MYKLLLLLYLTAQTGLAQDDAIGALKREWQHWQGQPAGYATDTLRCRALKAIMRAYLDVNVDSAMHYNGLMVELCQQPQLQQELTYAYQFMGHLHQVRGDYHQSIRFHYKALSLAEKLGQYTRMARSYSSLGHSYASLNDMEKATSMCRRGLALLRRYPDTTIELSILNAFGAVYRQQGKPAEALKVNQAMYALARREHVRWHEAEGLHAIGWDYMNLGELDKPLGYYQQALALARTIGARDLEESILLHMAELHQRRGNGAKAITYCLLVKQTAAELKNSSLLAEANERLYHLFKQTGQTEKALAAHEAFVHLRDSLSREKTEHRIETLRAQYDNVQKTSALQQEQGRNQQLAQTRNGLLIAAGVILLIASLLFGNMRRLQAKNQEIDRHRLLLEQTQAQLADANETLEKRVQERTEALMQANLELIRKNEEIKLALFKGQTIERKRVALELHDNLSSLLSAVNMSIQSINPLNLSDSEQSIYQNVKYMLRNAYAEVRNISHNILPAELEKEGLVPTLTALINRLNQNARQRFSLSVQKPAQRLPVEIEFNTYSIVLELINNAIKHAQAAAVSITLVWTGDILQVDVMDDGVGLGLPSIKRGVGLQNVEARLDSLGGTFRVLPVDRGTHIQLKIPVEAVPYDGPTPVA